MRHNIKVLRSEINNKIDYTEFYIRPDYHPNYSESSIFTETELEQIITKLETLIFTNKGEVISDPDFGLELESYLHEYNVEPEIIENEIKEQISIYIPELLGRYELAAIPSEEFEKESGDSSLKSDDLYKSVYILFMIDEKYDLVFVA